VKCPHCLENFYESWDKASPREDINGSWMVQFTTCPACDRLVIQLVNSWGGELRSWLVRPKAPSRAPLPTDVPDDFAIDYKEACLVLADSPKASAALSRRCLQHLLREKAGVKHSNLDSEIKETMGDLPSHLSDAIDAVRTIGNFAAHPIKSESTGEVVDVEPGEAEWNLDTLEGLFDHYFVQPALLKAKREALNEKLQDAGKPELKSADS
jgi:hypothetical protein